MAKPSDDTPAFYQGALDKAASKALDAAIKNLDSQGVVVGGQPFGTYVQEKFPGNVYTKYSQGFVGRVTDLFAAQRELDTDPTNKDALRKKSDLQDLLIPITGDFMIKDHVDEVILAAEKKDVRMQAHMVGQLEEYAAHKAALAPTAQLPVVHEGKTDSVTVADVPKELSAHNAILQRLEQSLAEAGFLPADIAHLVSPEMTQAKVQADKAMAPDTTPRRQRDAIVVTGKT